MRSGGRGTAVHREVGEIEEPGESSVPDPPPCQRQVEDPMPEDVEDIVAIAQSSYTLDRFHRENFFSPEVVMRFHRGRFLGSFGALRYFRENGFDEVGGGVHEQNRATRAMYAGLDFEEFAAVVTYRLII
jgi:hypothetical protein